MNINKDNDNNTQLYDVKDIINVFLFFFLSLNKHAVNNPKYSSFRVHVFLKCGID